MHTLPTLPYDVLVIVARQLDQGWTTGHKADILNLACTCRVLQRIAVEVMYESFCYDGSRNQSASPFVEYTARFYSSPETRNLRRLKLTHWSAPGNDPRWRDIASRTDFELYSPDTIANFIREHALALRELHIEHDLGSSFLYGLWPLLEELTVYPSSLDALGLHSNDASHLFPKEGILKCDFLPSVLSWPKLRRLTIQASSLYEFSAEPRLRPAHTTTRSSVEDLSLYVGNLSRHALMGMFQPIEKLRRFVFQPTTASDISDPYDCGSKADELPTCAEIGLVLEPHCATLEELCLGRADSYTSAVFDAWDTFAHYGKLRRLCVDLSMLRGWQHCEHLTITSNANAGAAPPMLGDLASMLPQTIESLQLIMEPQCFRQGECEHLVGIAECIVEEKRRPGLNQLDELHLQSLGRTLCRTCAAIATSEGTESREVPAQTSQAVLAYAKKALAEYGCELCIVKS